jgi:hypothetical protein
MVPVPLPPQLWQHCKARYWVPHLETTQVLIFNSAAAEKATHWLVLMHVAKAVHSVEQTLRVSVQVVPLLSPVHLQVWNGPQVAGLQFPEGVTHLLAVQTAGGVQSLVVVQFPFSATL